MHTLAEPLPLTTKVRSTSVLESFTYDDAIVRKFLAAMYLWSLVAVLVGIYIALQLIYPALTFGRAELTFGRLRPLHTNAAIFAFAGNAIFAAVYYSTQRLCKARMWSDKLGGLHFWGWQGVILAAALTLPFGITHGKEYAELEWPIDVAIAVVWLGFFGGNFFMALLRRRERHASVGLILFFVVFVAVSLRALAQSRKDVSEWSHLPLSDEGSSEVNHD